MTTNPNSIDKQVMAYAEEFRSAGKVNKGIGRARVDAIFYDFLHLACPFEEDKFSYHVCYRQLCFERETEQQVRV